MDHDSSGTTRPRVPLRYVRSGDDQPEFLEYWPEGESGREGWVTVPTFVIPGYDPEAAQSVPQDRRASFANAAIARGANRLAFIRDGSGQFVNREEEEAFAQWLDLSGAR